MGPARPRSAIARSICRRVAARPKGTTSTGRGKAPRRATSLLASAITAIRIEAAATIFSRRSAPPPPLMSRRSRVDLVGAVDRQIEFRQFLQRGERYAERFCLGRCGLRRRRRSGRPGRPRPSAPTKSTKWRAVEPEPSPSRIPGSTRSSARRAASRFSRSPSTLAVMPPLAFPNLAEPGAPRRRRQTVRSRKRRKTRASL